MRDAVSNLPTNRLYTGQEKDSKIGLYYYNARWYDSDLGRFVQPDTYVPESQEVLAFDRYAYVNNNPVPHLLVVYKSKACHLEHFSRKAPATRQKSSPRVGLDTFDEVVDILHAVLQDE